MHRDASVGHGVALAALDAVIEVRGAGGRRAAFRSRDFHRLPGRRPSATPSLQPGELITARRSAAVAVRRASHYLKVRDRASYAFALVSVAVALDIDGERVRERAHRARRRRAQALARAARRSSALDRPAARCGGDARAAATRRCRGRAAVPRQRVQGRRSRGARSCAQLRIAGGVACTTDGQPSVIGQPLDRVGRPAEGHRRRAVRGGVPTPRTRATPCMVLSTMPRGRIVTIDTQPRAARARRAARAHASERAASCPSKGRAAVKPPAGRVLSLLQDDLVHYNGQPVALVVADTLEHAPARRGAGRVEYAGAAADHDFAAAKRRCVRAEGGRHGSRPTHVGRSRGRRSRGRGASRCRRTRRRCEHHNRMEPHATVAHGKATA